MSVAVVTQAELNEVLREVEQLKRRLAVVEQGGAKTAREYLTPKQVARTYGIDHTRVYAALRDGKLAAEKRPGNGREVNWRIRPDDARRWYDAFERLKSNQ